MASNFHLFDIEEEPFDFDRLRRGSIPREDESMELKNVSFDRIKGAGIVDLFQLSQAADIQNDERLTDSEDIRERLILIKRKLEGSSHVWKHFFTSVRKEKDIKIDTLINIMKTVETTFRTIPTESLSEIMWKEGHLHKANLLGELETRIRNLKERKSLVIIAGETNGGKSTFLNLLLGKDILPTDILHCTLAICRIEYSETYRIKTVDLDGQEEVFPSISFEEAKKILKDKVSQQEMKERQHGASVKEITLGLPSDILKSGVTLVDTPGIGETEIMDDVTMNFVKSTHASAFIYIIKSDTAGGVQEDRLLSFLRAIKEKYQSDEMCETFDPRAALFVCHRWDNIEEDEKEKVKKNALTRLEYVWPCFEPSQTFFFSTTNTNKHLPVDPAFVTDSYYELLKGLKQLFDRATYNAIKHQYIWLKYMLQPAAKHLKSMITHCIRSNEELEKYFQTVAEKQERLRISSLANSRNLQLLLDTMSNELLDKIRHFLNFDNISPKMEIDDFDELKEICAPENYLSSKENRYELDERIVRSLLTYTDEHIHAMQIVHDMEQKMLQEIQRHLGLFKSQIHQIKHDMLHGESHAGTPTSPRRSLSVDDLDSRLGSSVNSTISITSNSSMEETLQDWTMDPINLASTVKGLLVKRKNRSNMARGVINGKYEMRQTLFGKLRDKIVYGNRVDPEAYLIERIQKVAKKMRGDEQILDCIVRGYTNWIQDYVNHATRSIPQFLEVNTKLMDVIREHRGSFQRDKDLLLKVMEDLEPSRHHLSGYGELFMADINANMITFSSEQKYSSVYLPRDIVASYRKNDDSGFRESSSKKRKVKSLWGRMQGAVVEIDGQVERIVVKSYIYDMDEKLLLSEIASLRCLDDKSIAPFFGMTRIRSGSSRGNNTLLESQDTPVENVSAFIFRGDLISARVHSRRKMTNMQLFVPDLVLGLLRGLNYIHRERLVHMELNLDTVMVDKVTGAVKICQMCKPREARFPSNMDIQTRNCVYLSPSVLQGQMYENTDDLYSFGLLLWESLFPQEPPFADERQWPLRRFIDTCHPSAMLKQDLMNLDVSEEVKEVLKGVLLVSRGSVCMPIATAQSCLRNISQEPAVLRLRSRSPSYPPFVGGVRRKSSDSTPVVEITSASGKKVNFHENESLPPYPQVLKNPPGSPTRPPRPRRHQKLYNGKASSFDEEETKPVVPLPSDIGTGRRQSAPVVLRPPSVKDKRPFTILKGLFTRNHHPKKHNPDESSFSDSGLASSHNGHSKTKHTKKNKRLSVDSGLPSASAVPGYDGLGGKAAKFLGLTQTRRFSLQEKSLYGEQVHSQNRNDNGEGLDVLEKLCKDEFVPPLERSTKSGGNNLEDYSSSTRSNIKASELLAGSMPCLAHCDLDDDSLSHSCRSHKQVKELSSPGSRSHGSPGHHRRHFFDENPARKMGWNEGRRHSAAVISTGYLKQHVGDSVDHTNHAIGPIFEANTETSQQEELETTPSGSDPKFLRLQAWRRGSLDFNKDKRTQTSIQELVAAVSSNSLVKSSSLSPKPAILQLEEKASTVTEKSPSSPVVSSPYTLSVTTPREDSPIGDLSSSTTSKGDSGFLTDTSGRSVPRPTSLFNNPQTDISTAAELWDSSSYEKFLELPKATHVRSSSAPVDMGELEMGISKKYSWDEDAQSAEVLLTNSVRGLDPDGGNNSPAEPGINDSATSNSRPTPNSQAVNGMTESQNRSSMPPPPPPINFDLLSFGKSDMDILDEGLRF